MSLPKQTSVLIVGAGPTGLAVALSLIHHGFRDFVIVDALNKGENSSRAIVVHAATLEALDSIDCGDDLVSQGTIGKQMNIGSRSEVLVATHYDCLRSYTRHPYFLVIPQALTEDVLQQKLMSLGVTVHRPHSVVGMKANPTDVNITDITFDDGQVITAKYIIGADGARSVVRTIAGIGFSDPKGSLGDNSTTLAQIAQGDVTFSRDLDLARTGFRGTMSPNSIFLCVPFPSTFNEYLAKENGTPIKDTIFRVITGVPVEDGEVPSVISKEYLQGLINKYGPFNLSSDPSVNPSDNPIQLKDVIWSTRFRTHSSIADTFFTRLPGGESPGSAVFLVGDAAHIHSPAGGQGMNLGLRDAVFLGEALTKHIKASESEPLIAADKILIDFAATRHANALEVITLTKMILATAGAKNECVAWWLPINKLTLRDWFLWLFGKIDYIQRQAVWAMSGLGRR